MSHLDFDPLPLVQQAIVALALPSSEQVRVTQPGCVTCELLEEFRHAFQCYQLLDYDAQDPALIASLSELEEFLEQIDVENFECGNEKVLDGTQWSSIRLFARQLLTQFGWNSVIVEPYRETQPRVWNRPLPGTLD
jgi:hypothetical protein